MYLGSTEGARRSVSVATMMAPNCTPNIVVPLTPIFAAFSLPIADTYSSSSIWRMQLRISERDGQKEERRKKGCLLFLLASLVQERWSQILVQIPAPPPCSIMELLWSLMDFLHNCCCLPIQSLESRPLWELPQRKLVLTHLHLSQQAIQRHHLMSRASVVDQHQSPACVAATHNQGREDVVVVFFDLLKRQEKKKTPNRYYWEGWMQTGSGSAPGQNRRLFNLYYLLLLTGNSLWFQVFLKH